LLNFLLVVVVLIVVKMDSAVVSCSWSGRLLHSLPYIPVLIVYLYPIFNHLQSCIYRKTSMECRHMHIMTIASVY
jgi:hypothetical protein